MRHQNGIWNTIWSNMIIQTSHIKIGKGPVGVIGFTTSSTAMFVLGKSMHSKTNYISELYAYRGEKILHQITHTMESKEGIDPDEIDCSKLRSFITNCIHPLSTDCDKEILLCNIVTGQIAAIILNVNKSVLNGKALVTKFKEKVP